MSEPKPVRPRGAGPTVFAAGLALSLLAALAACNIPTELPSFDTRWIVPAEETRFGVAQLLPGDVSVAPDSSTFIVDIDSVSFSRSLGEVCVGCGPAHGLTVPKPPFLGTVESQVAFPPEVYEISVLSGQVTMKVTNDFGFDPIRPSSTARGTMTLRVTDDADGDVLSELVVDGSDTAFPSGTTMTRDLALGQLTVNGSLVATVVLDSPLGDPVTIDTTALFSVVATPSNIRVVSVSVDVSSEAVTFDPVDLGVEDVDDNVRDAVHEGAFILDVTNPFGVTADFDLSITGPEFAPIQRTATIGPAVMSTLRLEFSGVEIQEFLGTRDVRLTGGAVVDSGAGIVTVLPGQELVLKASLEVTMQVNGSN